MKTQKDKGLFLMLLFAGLFIGINASSAVSLAIEPQAAVGEERLTVATDYPKQALQCLGKLRQLFRPLINIKMEYTVERKKGETWAIAQREILQYNFQKGFFRKKTLSKFNNNTSVLHYREIAWDGEKSIVAERVFGYNKELHFVEDPSVTGTNDAIIYGDEISLFSWFPLFFTGRTVDRTYGGTMVGILGGLKEEDIDVQFEIDRFKILLKQVGIRVIIDAKTGMLLEKSVLAPSDDGYSAKSTEEVKLSVSRTTIKDGWQIPTEYILIRKDELGKIVDEAKIKIRPESIIINAPPSHFDLSVDLPVGTKVRNEIEKISYIITDFDVKNKNERLKKKLDLLLKNASKNEENKR